MTLGINTNLPSLNAQRNLNASQATVGKALQRLSSGLRINSAGDDAAGLAISERFTTQIRGLSQAIRNANDGISLLQTADGALAKVSDNLQRIRELGVQAANATNSDTDRAALQAEVSQLAQEVDRIGRQTSFNGEKVFGQSGGSVVGDSDVLDVLDGLQSGWLTQAEQIIKEQYGIEAKGEILGINLTDSSDGASGTLAYVQFTFGATGPATSMTLYIDMADFTPVSTPSGGNAPFYNDRVLMHELTHAVMGATMNLGSFQANNETFFMEGAAELIHGADERLLARIGLGGAGIANVMGKVAQWGVAWDGTDDAYAAAYAGMRYLDQEIKAAGGTGIKDVMMYLAADSTRTLDDALANATSGAFADFNDFKTDFTTNGTAFITDLLTSGSLQDADTGAIGGANASGGPVKTAASVVPDGATRSGEDQLEGFSEQWEQVRTASYSVASRKLQVGADVGQTLEVGTFAMSGAALDIMDVDVVANANRVISKMDRALDYVNARRADLGASLNRLDSVIANLSTNVESLTASRSRVQDTDYAVETATLTRGQILQQAGIAMLAQANTTPQMVLQLLQ